MNKKELLEKKNTLIAKFNDLKPWEADAGKDKSKTAEHIGEPVLEKHICQRPKSPKGQVGGDQVQDKHGNLQLADF